ncbi:hypothetical protein [Mesorhizobium sp.]|uniref:hypothetical protein n=1 Tax=Mesorhizobium sp. TaxID=1871066 RepID=UPI0025D3BAA4|nr:hypothetical protein [Mesorhizobium sp.]
MTADGFLLYAHAVEAEPVSLRAGALVKGNLRTIRHGGIERRRLVMTPYAITRIG